jgi:uncharacterized protein (TIGR02996 family)
LRDLVRAVLEDPSADAPRLVYADHLTEIGDPRGELIQLQMALARGSGAGVARERIRVLIEQCWEQLVEPVRRVGVQRFCIRRGFVEAVVLDAPYVGALGPLTDELPIVEVRVDGSRKGALALAEMPEVLKLRVLDFTDLRLGDRRLSEILRSGRLANVSVLVLSGNRLSRGAAEALARAARHLPCLEHLYVDRNDLGTGGVGALLRSPLSQQLVSVRLDPEHLDADAEARLGRSSCTWAASPWGRDDGAGVWF